MCALINRDTTGQIILINDERTNTGVWETSGIDFAARYGLPTRDFGRFTLVVDGTVLQTFKITDQLGVVTDAKGNYDLASVNTINGALPVFKMNAGVLWSMGGLGAGVTARYVGSYKECDNGIFSQGDATTLSRTISSYLPIDLYATYAFKTGAGMTSFMVGVQNVADVNPPYIYNAFSANSDPATYGYVGRFFYARVAQTY